MHPLDDGSAGVLHRSVEQTAAGLGRDGSRWRLAFGYPASEFDALSEDIMGPLLRVPHHPLMLARFGAPTVLPASTVRPRVPHRAGPGVVRRCCGPCLPATALPDDVGDRDGHHRARATGTAGRWPRVARSRSPTRWSALLSDLGGKIETGVRVETASQLPPADVTMFDLAPSAVAGILGDRLPRRISRAFTRFRRGPGAFKVDFAVEGGVPWTNPDAHRAGTVHVAGTYAELAATERDDPRRPHARAARSCWSVSSIWPTRNARWAISIRCGATRTSPTATPATRPRRSSPRSSGSRPASGNASSATRSLDDADGRLQPQLRRRRHHDRRQGHPRS